MPSRLLRYHWFLVAMGSIVIYTLLALVLPATLMIVIMNGLFTGLVVAVTLLFFPLFIRAVKTKEFDRVSQLTIGIILTWASLILTRSLNVTSHATNDCSIATSSPLVSVAAYIAIVGGILHITAPGMIENKLKYNKGLLATAAIVGLAVTAAAIMWQGVPLL